jgi:O-antigen biosynthesis protein WbqP
VGALKRLFDGLIAILVGLFLAPVALAIALLVRFSSPGPVLYWSSRIGIHNRAFKMPKFRTMQTGVPVVATHLLKNAEDHLTPVGAFLRANSLDEIPQLWCILCGTMSFVGPRPALWNQEDLIALRTESGIEKIRPGLTGWAQVNGRDNLTVAEKVHFDREYLENKSLALDVKIVLLTIVRVTTRNGISH